VTGKLVSLSKARKARARDDRKRRADANAAKFGRSKADRMAEAARTDAETRRLEDHRRDEE
jgi:hypothetical protein